MKSFSIVLVVAALLMGGGRWEAPTPGRFETTLRGSGSLPSMNVTVQDSTGLVRAVGPGVRSRGATDGVSNDPGAPDTLTVSVLTGACDDDMLLSFRAEGTGYRLVAVVRQTSINIGMLCFLYVGISRTVTLVLATPVQAASIEFEVR